jgi:hypothetical protein
MLITDKGTDFVNIQLTTLLTTICKIRKIHTTPQNPRADGLAENQVKTVKDMLAAYTNQYQTDWDTHLDKIQYNYNTTINSATGYTPYYLLFGRNANCQDHDPEELRNIIPSLNDYVLKFSEIMNSVWDTVGTEVHRNVDTMIRQQNPLKHLPFKPFKAGDFCFIRYIPKRFYKTRDEERIYKLSAKLQARWMGPYLITAVKSLVLYEIDIHRERRVFHAVNMRPY